VCPLAELKKKEQGRVLNSECLKINAMSNHDGSVKLAHKRPDQIEHLEFRSRNSVQQICSLRWREINQFCNIQHRFDECRARAKRLTEERQSRFPYTKIIITVAG